MNHKDVTDGYQQVLKELAELQAAKISEYGISRYQETDPRAAMMMVYNDVYRKFIRLRTQVFDRILNGHDLDMSAIRESLRDGANYNGMGVQMVDLLDPANRMMALAIKDAETHVVRHEPPLAQFPIEQIALAVKDHESIIPALGFLGATEWHKDDVTTRAMVLGQGPVEQVAELSFNYQLIPGKELELIRYVSGRNFLGLQGISTGLSHLGLHVESIDHATERLNQLANNDVQIIQDAVTIKHTNPAIKNTRRYRYRIFGTRQWLGFDLKFIQRKVLDMNRYFQKGAPNYIGWESYDLPGNEWLKVEIPEMPE